MAVCPWGTETNRCCLEVGMCVRWCSLELIYPRTLMWLQTFQVLGNHFVPLLRTYRTVWQNWQSKESYIWRKPGRMRHTIQTPEDRHIPLQR